MALKEHFRARYRLSDLILAQKNDKMTSNLSKWIRTVVEEKVNPEEDRLQYREPVLQELKDLIYHTADGVVACRRRDEEKLVHKHNLIIYLSNGSVVQIARSDGKSRDRQGKAKNITSN